MQVTSLDIIQPLQAPPETADKAIAAGKPAAGEDGGFGNLMGRALALLQATTAASTGDGQGQEIAAGSESGGGESGKKEDAKTADTAISAATDESLTQIILGPTLNIITANQAPPATDSLHEFARAQGFDEQAIHWLLGPQAASPSPAIRTAFGGTENSTPPAIPSATNVSAPAVALTAAVAAPEVTTAPAVRLDVTPAPSLATPATAVIETARPAALASTVSQLFGNGATASPRAVPPSVLAPVASQVPTPPLTAPGPAQSLMVNQPIAVAAASAAPEPTVSIASPASTLAAISGNANLLSATEKTTAQPAPKKETTLDLNADVADWLKSREPESPDPARAGNPAAESSVRTTAEPSMIGTTPDWLAKLAPQASALPAIAAEEEVNKPPADDLAVDGTPSLSSANKLDLPAAVRSTAGTSIENPVKASLETLLQQRNDESQRLASRMGEAIAQRMIHEIGSGNWQLKLSLRPATLGSIDIDMRMHGGGLDASFSAAHTMTRDLLNDGLGRLRDTLTNSGMDVANLNVGDGQARRGGGDSTPRQPPQWSAKAGNAESSANEAGIAPVASRSVSNSDGLDVTV